MRSSSGGRSVRKPSAPDTPEWLQGEVVWIGRRRKGIPTAESFSDFRLGLDEIRRWDGHIFLVDREGLYAPVEVRPDEISCLEAFRQSVETEIDIFKLMQEAVDIARYTYMRRGTTGAHWHHPDTLASTLAL